MEWQAGRELDQKIGAELFGYHLYHYDKGHAANCYYMLLDGEGEPVHSDPGFHGGERKTPIAAWRDCPRFSEDIAAAWLIVEHLRGKGWEWHVSYNSITDHLAMVSLFRYEGDQIPEDYEGNANTAPLAICIAALALVAEKTTAQ
jgi:hypothetical protein